MDRRILALPLLLLFSGCGFCATPLFQMPSVSAPVAGDPDGIRKFAGDWFDENGNLIAVISGSPEPRLSVRTPYDLEPKDVRLQDGKIVFRLTSNDPEDISLRLTNKDELQVTVAEESSCGCTDVLPVAVLIRNPSPAWLMKQSALKATQKTAIFARDAYYGTMDRLARAL